jgi:hypothetical protein
VRISGEVVQKLRADFISSHSIFLVSHRGGTGLIRAIYALDGIVS